LQKQTLTYFFTIFGLLLIIPSLKAQDTIVEPKDSLRIDTIKHVRSTVPKKSKEIEAKVTYSSVDSIVFNVADKKVITYGDGKILYETIDLQSEYIALNIADNEVFAKGIKDSLMQDFGSPKYKDDSESFDADSMKYNFKSKQGLAYGIKTQQDEGYLHGGKTKIHNNKEIHIQHGKYTTCDADCPHFYLEISKGKVIPNDKIIFGPSWLVIDQIPIPIVLPFGFFPNKKGRANGIILPSLGEDYNKGFYFKNMGFYWGLNDYVDMKLTGDIYTLGSWRSNLRTRYKVKYKFDGSVDIGYSSIVLDELRQAPQFNVRWSHSQDAKSMSGGRFNASVDYGSQGYSRQNSFDEDEYLKSEVGSNISYSKSFTGTPIRLSANFAHRQNNKDSTISLTLPSVKLTANSMTPFSNIKSGSKSRFYNKISINYSSAFDNKLASAKMDSTLYTSETLDAFEKTINHTASVGTSIKFLKYINISPSASYREDWYFEKTDFEFDEFDVYDTSKNAYIGGIDTILYSEFNRVYTYNANVRFTTNIYGLYQYKSRYLKAIRHHLAPSVSYNIAPNFTDSKYGYYSYVQTNDDGDSLLYSHYDKSLSNSKSNILNFAINNSFEAKIRDRKDTVTGFKKVQLLKLNLSTSYDFEKDSNRLAPITIGGSSNLIKRMTIYYSATANPYALIKKEIDGGQENVVSNTYMLDKYNRVWRKNNENWSTSLKYTLGPQKDKSKVTVDDYGDYTYWDVPWSLSFNYSIRLKRNFYYNYYNEIDSVINNPTQTLGADFSLSLTPKWNIKAKTSWDFDEKQISFARISLNRDLHCWQMAFNWTAFGPQKGWNFSLRVKSDMLKDIKYEMQSTNTYF